MAERKWKPKDETPTQTTKTRSRYPLRQINGQQYLEVKYRIMWFREEHPTWSIETEALHSDKDSAFFKATVRDEQGRVIATGHKRESRHSFPDFDEKAETGAVGRALALIGYGTQFAIDEGHRIVDSPTPEEDGGREKAPPVELPENYQVPFGKYRGRALKNIPPDDLRNYCEYLARTARSENKTLSPQVRQFLAQAHHVLSHREAS